MNIAVSTEDAQNRVLRLDMGLELNIDKPSPKIKKQFAKVRKDILELHLSLDLLNDMKEELYK